MKKTIIFYKEANSDWFADLPEWEGSKVELQMVSGSDSMLEYMAEGENKVTTIISTEPLVGANELIFVSKAEDIGSGAYYLMKTYGGIEINLTLWLCDVTLFVFGEFPKVISIIKV